MDILIKALQLILSLSILVVLHELGHFVPAKLFKTKVEKFFLFFDAYFSLFKVKIGETVYGLGWIPLGGYVKIAGMIDESMDKEQLKQPAQEWEFRSKPTWQRLIIMLGGVAVNLVLGMFIYAMIMFTWGEKYLPNENVTYGIMVDSLGIELGLQNGDKIVSVDGKTIHKFVDFMPELLLSENTTFTVNREGKHEQITLVNDDIKKILQGAEKGIMKGLILPRMPFIIAAFSKGSVAKESGLEVGDHFLSVDGQETQFYDQFKKQIQAHKGQEVSIKVRRGEETKVVYLTVPETGIIGVYNRNLDEIFEYATVEYGFFESFPAGIRKGINVLGGYIKQFKLIFSPSTGAYKSVGSVLQMGNMFSPKWDWLVFWNMTALLSLILAFMNLLPIPALDGGHVVFLLYEMFTGRKPSEKVLEYAQMLGFILLISIMALAFSNDIRRFFF